MTNGALQVPLISQAELESFHNAHFGHAGTSHFTSTFLPSHDAQQAEQSSHFLQQVEVYGPEEEDQEDDGLGYYDDGAKRTLTDEQIAMFRHSELEALRRAQESGHPKPAAPDTTERLSQVAQRAEEAEPGDLPSEDDNPSETNKTAGKKKKRRRTKTRVEPEKPDLRKRTWDVVDTGLASLDYGDEPQHPTAMSRPTQRRHISYED